MKVEYTGRGVEINDRLRDFTRSKLDRLSKHLVDIHNLHVVLSVEKYRHRAEIKFSSAKKGFHGTEETTDMFQSIDGAVDKLETQVKKYKEKLNASKRNTTQTIRQNHVPEAEPSLSAGEREYRVIRRQAPVRPMNLDEAVDELDKLKHDFIVFRDSESDTINVVYRRKDGHVGLIDPRT